MPSIFSRLILLLVIVSSVTACSPPEEKEAPAEKVTVQLKWLHQAQFAGFYVAREKGFFQEENLKVTFLEGGPQIDIAKTLVAGQADFAVMAPEDLLIKRSQGIPLTAVAAIYRRSAVVFLSLPGSNIKRPFDFIGKTVAVAGKEGSVRDFEFQFHALARNLDLDVERMDIVPYDPEFKSFLSKDVDVTATYMTGGLVRLRQKGYQPKVIWPGDYGVHFYSDILVTREEIIQNHPDKVKRFVRASLKGWRKAIGDPEAALAAVMPYARIKDEAVQMGMMEAMLPLVHTGEDRIGWMRRRQWREMIRIMHDQEILPKSFQNTDEVFTMRFLESVYGEEVDRP